MTFDYISPLLRSLKLCESDAGFIFGVCYFFYKCFRGAAAQKSCSASAKAMATRGEQQNICSQKITWIVVSCRAA